MTEYIKKYPERATKLLITLDDFTPYKIKFLSFNKKDFDNKTEQAKNYLQKSKSKKVINIKVLQRFYFEEA